MDRIAHLACVEVEVIGVIMANGGSGVGSQFSLLEDGCGRCIVAAISGTAVRDVNGTKGILHNGRLVSV